ncbi:MAG TPA: MBOAT family protein [Devosia sp.]|nr:MBOAT family protein [Devosia sp.]
MVFSSVIFLFVFLPGFLAIYYVTPRAWRNLVIVLGSYLFYGWWRLDFLALLIATTLWNYALGLRIVGASDRAISRRWLMLAIAGNLGVLGYFKYCNFFASSFSAAFLGGAPLSPLLGNVILPIGVSFFVFQAISYVTDLYRGDAKHADNLIDFAAFKALFPQLVAGPVLRYKDLEDQFANRTHSFEKFGEGATRFMQGLARKVLIADTVAPIADMFFAAPNPTMGEAWLGTVAYAIQLYFDFSGYSSMAIGLGLMIGFRFTENFHFPYVSRSITEFWRRWHMSLSAWLRDYLYIPLGGSRKGTVRTYVNLFLTMLLGGIWHGANWTFVLWGAWHGAILAIERALGVQVNDRRPVWAWAITMLIVAIGWVLFRAPNVGVAFDIYGGMLGLNGFAIRDIYQWQITGISLLGIVLGIVVCCLEPRFDAAAIADGVAERFRSRVAYLQAGAWAFAFIAIGKLIADSDSPFLYFQF